MMGLFNNQNHFEQNGELIIAFFLVLKSIFDLPLLHQLATFLMKLQSLPIIPYRKHGEAKWFIHFSKGHKNGEP